MASISVPSETLDSTTIEPATGSGSEPGCERPLRADARRNRDKVMAAARAAFAEHGSEAQMDDVARRASVGVGTVYRHFPTKDALIVALIQDTFARVAERSRAALQHDDAWAAFTSLMWEAGERIAGDRALAEAMQADVMGQTCPGELELRSITEQLMERAKAAGAMRPDAVIDDIPMLMCGIGSATVRKHAFARAWRRHLAIALDGLRARPDLTPLPE
jgi:AcrR family transcriptional regulator